MKREPGLNRVYPAMDHYYMPGQSGRVRKAVTLRILELGFDGVGVRADGSIVPIRIDKV